MHEKRPDRRVLRTKKSIRNALAKLLTQKNAELISVRELADTADISRKTFYNYYTSVAEVIDEMEREIVCSFLDALTDTDFAQIIQNPSGALELLTQVLQQDLDFYTYILSCDCAERLCEKISRALIDALQDFVAQDADISQQESVTMLLFCISGMFAVYRAWFHSGRTTPLEEISRTISTLSYYGTAGYISSLKQSDESCAAQEEAEETEPIENE